MTAEELLNELLSLRDLHGSLKDVPVSVFLGNDRLDIRDVDAFLNHDFKETGKQELHSIDLNARYYTDEY
jgi:hypothetical protein